MPALPVVLNVARISLIQSRGTDSDVVNRIFMNFFTAGGTSSQMTTLCGQVAGSWNTRLAPLMGSQVTLTEVVGEDLTSATAAVGSVVVSHAGTRAGTNLSASACALVRNQIARRYRGGHPRTYLPALTTPDLSSANVWSPSSLASLVTAWTNFISDVEGYFAAFTGGGAAAHCNVSYFHDFTSVENPITHRWRNVPTLRPTPLVDTVVSYAANPNVCSQRRRNQAP